MTAKKEIILASLVKECRLKFLQGHQDERFLSDKEELTKATLMPHISYVDFDEETQAFQATVDKILFKSPYEIVSAVLHANGFMLNLENLLACIDSFRFGVRAKGNPTPEGFQTSGYFPAIHFTMPQRSKIGELLGQFYKEIDVYEAQLAGLQDKPKKKADDDQGIDELRREIKRLREENHAHEQTIKALSSKLNDMNRSHAVVTRALESHSILPDGMRLATVREIQIKERQLTLRSNRKSFTVPMAMIDRLPDIDDPCLIYLEDGLIKSVFFYKNQGTAFKSRLAEVLFIQADKIKFRDADRNVWVVDALNEAERLVIHSLKRGKMVLLHLIEDQLIRFEECQESHPEIFEQLVQESISMQQIKRNREVLHKQSRRMKKEAAG